MAENTDSSNSPASNRTADAAGPVKDAAAPSLPGLLRPPSRRLAGALAAGMLAIGVAGGAAIGPAPSASFAGASRLPLLLPSLIAAAGSGTATPAPTSAGAPAITPSPLPGRRRSLAAALTPPSATPLGAGTPAASGTSPEEATPSPPASGSHQSTLPPITNVWLIELTGSTFADALAQPAAAPYIAGQAVRAGTLLSGWSALEASGLASDAALLAGSPPQVLDTIVQPPCPEGAAGAQCAAGTPGGLTAADTFLSQTIPTLTANPAYHSSGLIVITFGSVLSATATGLPAGAATATVTAQPPAGALLISPFAKPGVRPAAKFNPASPKQSLQALLHR